MSGRARRNASRNSTSNRSARRATRNALGNAQINLAKALAAVFAAGVYNKEELQSAVCTFVAEMRDSGETGEGVVRAAQGMVREVGERFPSSGRTQVLLADMVTWCLAEYYRESA